ncbi:hypothetical protein QE414_000076 [Microbacterium sp. SORGH_AS 344]|nr:hypothetical protein [Microbacterium sp. SORGH_AS_0344]
MTSWGVFLVVEMCGSTSNRFDVTLGQSGWGGKNTSRRSGRAIGGRSRVDAVALVETSAEVVTSSERGPTHDRRPLAAQLRRGSSLTSASATGSPRGGASRGNTGVQRRMPWRLFGRGRSASRRSASHPLQELVLLDGHDRRDRSTATGQQDGLVARPVHDGGETCSGFFYRDPLHHVAARVGDPLDTRSARRTCSGLTRTSRPPFARKSGETPLTPRPRAGLRALGA